MHMFCFVIFHYGQQMELNRIPNSIKKASTPQQANRTDLVVYYEAETGLDLSTSLSSKMFFVFFL